MFFISNPSLRKFETFMQEVPHFPPKGMKVDMDKLEDEILLFEVEKIIISLKQNKGKERIMINCNETVENILIKQLDAIPSDLCVLILDYLLRLSMYKNRQIKKIYLCYDNLDAIENAEDLRDFDRKLFEVRNLLDDFIINVTDEGFFDQIAPPHFVIIATYRKITARMAQIYEKTYNEVQIDKDAGNDQNKFIFHIDVTSVFSYKKIVQKRKTYFINFFKTANNISSLTKEKLLRDFISWDQINQKLEIMDDKYACLWNMNYRTCSIIANKLYSNPEYDFPNLVEKLENPVIKDGYNKVIEKDSGDNVLGTYYGGSAFLLSSVCKVFHDNHIWDDFLKLAQLKKEPPSYKYVSLSRIILTYIYNNNEPVSLQDLFNRFCKENFFPYKLLCQILSKMLARNLNGVWRRPIYYAKDYIFSENSEEIKNALLDECIQLYEGKNPNHDYKFLLCDSGKSYVERLMQEFEFFSNRLSNNNQPLYLYDNTEEVKLIINDVWKSVSCCCDNMLDFRTKYIKIHNITEDEYLHLPIHPITNFSKTPQLHTERVIFSHIAYLNNVRCYFLDDRKSNASEKKKKYNKIFVDAIDNYLTIYYEKIFPLTTVRQKVANSLKEIVDEIKQAIKNKSDDSDVLFQSISLNQIGN